MSEQTPVVDDSDDSAADDEFDSVGTVALASSLCLQGERLALTGTLASMTHAQAAELIAANGGETAHHVSRQTTMLVVGEEGWPLEEDGHASVKLQQAVELINQGVPLRILKESDWLLLLGLEERNGGIHRLFTPAMLQQKLGVPVGVVRRWERLGLIRAAQRVHRLPYFDFQEVAGVRRLKEMLEAGVPRERIEAGLTSLQTLFPSMDHPLRQLELLARDAQVLGRDDHSLLDIHSGQRLFDFDESSHDAATTDASSNSTADEPRTGGQQPDDPVAISIPIPRWRVASGRSQANWSAEQWFEYGCRMLEEHHAEAAVDAFRMSLMEEPDDPEIHFHLADALFRMDNISGALERYHMAVELDHEFIEAWTQLGCVYQQLGRSEEALAAFDIALDVHPDFADAIYHKADVLAAAGKTEEAVRLWRRYLEFDSHGPWAEAAQMQIDQSGIGPDRTPF